VPTSPTFTNRRVYRNAYALLAFQAAAHAPVSDFSAAQSLFAREFAFDPQADKPYSYGAEAKPYKLVDGRFLSSIKPVAALKGYATPKNLEALLRSWGGYWQNVGGGQENLVLTENLNELATLALVENKNTPNPEYVTRAWDMWAHRVLLTLSPGPSALMVEAGFIGRDYDRTALNALGGITLPSSFAPPGMEPRFTPINTRLFRDPAGANVSVAVEELQIEFEQGFGHENWNDRAPIVAKRGYTTIALKLRGTFEDETYAILKDAEAVTFRRFKAQFVSDSKSLVIDLANVDFTVAPVGWRNGRFVFEVDGEAFMGDDEVFATISLVP
jgi:hypothetical protein